MKLLYVMHARMPTEKAHGVQVVSMCGELSKAGVDVTLVLPRRKNAIKNDIFTYYGIKKTFDVVFLKTPDLIKLGTVGFRFQGIIFAWKAYRWSKKHKHDYIFVRDLIAFIMFAHFAPLKTVYEVHTLPKNISKLYIDSLRKIQKIISQNIWKKDFLVEKANLEEEKFLVAPNGFDAALFPAKISKDDARKKLGFPNDKRIVLYAGHLYDWKGASVLGAVSDTLSDDTAVVFVGGTEKDVVSFRETYKKAYVLGTKPHADIPFYLKAADIVVLPNVPTTQESKFETSPIKLFEYMASGTPIIASDLPSIREVLNEETGYFFEAGNSDALKETIEHVFSDEENDEKSKNAQSASSSFTWKKRAELVRNHISQA